MTYVEKRTGTRSGRRIVFYELTAVRGPNNSKDRRPMGIYLRRVAAASDGAAIDLLPGWHHQVNRISIEPRATVVGAGAVGSAIR